MLKCWDIPHHYLPSFLHHDVKSPIRNAYSKTARRTQARHYLIYTAQVLTTYGHTLTQFTLLLKGQFTIQQATKAQKGYSFTLSATSALDGGGWSTPRPGRCTPKKRSGTHCIGGRMGPRAALYECGKSRSPPGFDPQTVQPVAIPTTLSDLLCRL